MDFETLRQSLNRMTGAAEERPFGPQALVYKVCGKMFALVSLESDPLFVTLKCEPTLALHLRTFYESVKPGYHMNKKHWNSVYLEGDVPDRELGEMIKDSYDLVVGGLTRADRERLESLG